VSFAAITLCVASELVFIVVSVYFFMTQSGNFWIHSCMFTKPASDPVPKLALFFQLKCVIGIRAGF
jgi:hypothetical protein